MNPKPLVFFLCSIPAIRLLWLGFNQQLGANPIEFITRSTGTWAITFLCITLAISPIRQLTQQTHFLKYRRMLGLFTFFYACLHVFTWIGLDHQGEWEAILNDLTKRSYLTLGLVTFILLIPLGLTSNHYAQKKLGRSWKKLHRFVYLIAILAALHYWRHKAGKNDYQAVSIYATVIFLLLFWRILKVFKQEHPKA